MESIAIVGSGNGGLAMAGHLGLLGYSVHLYDKFIEAILPIRERGGIQVKSELVNGNATFAKVTTDLAEAIRGCSLIIIVTPAFAHREIAENMAEHLLEGQAVVLHPGRTGGALEFKNILRRYGLNTVVAETQTMLYASRRTGPTEVTIYGIKRKVELAALPSKATESIVARLNQALPYFTPSANVLYTSFHNIGAVFHPAPMILNTGRIESENSPFEYYHEGITPTVGSLLEKIDEERVEVAKAYGVVVPRAKDWLQEAYGVEGETLWEAIHKNSTYSGITAPNSMHSRYLSEDVPMSLVPISCLAKMADVATPAIDAIIELASVIHGIDYRETGRNLQALGLDNSVDSLWRMLDL